MILALIFLLAYFYQKGDSKNQLELITYLANSLFAIVFGVFMVSVFCYSMWIMDTSTQS